MIGAIYNGCFTTLSFLHFLLLLAATANVCAFESLTKQYKMMLWRQRCIWFTCVFRTPVALCFVNSQVLTSVICCMLPFPLFQNGNHHQNSAKTIENVYESVFFYILIAFNKHQFSGNSVLDSFLYNKHLLSLSYDFWNKKFWGITPKRFGDKTRYLSYMKWLVKQSKYMII